MNDPTTRSTWVVLSATGDDDFKQTRSTAVSHSSARASLGEGWAADGRTCDVASRRADEVGVACDLAVPIKVTAD